jgi:SAM-dependent methyltransferase
MSGPSCRLCAGSELHKVLHIPKAARNIERLLDKEALPLDAPVAFTVYRCENCGHVQLAEELASDYYEEYLMTHSHAKKMQEFQKKQANAFTEYFGLVGKKVFEAGCGDGQFSSVLRSIGCEVTANEPSSKAREACRNKGLTTVGGYVSEESFHDLHGHFDAVIARQVLEHVPAPNDFVRGLRALLKPHGAGLIEVPSLEQALEHKRFFDFFPDHLSYFSSEALAHLLSRNRLEIIKIFRTMDGEYNEVWFRRKECPDFSLLQNAADSISGSFNSFLEKESRHGRRVAIWGAGAKGVLTLSSVDTSAVAYLIDTDPVKHGRFTPVSHLQVHPPGRLSADPVDTVIITALAYKDEITSQLRQHYRFSGQISYLSGGDILDE